MAGIPSTTSVQVTFTGSSSNFYTPYGDSSIVSSLVNNISYCNTIYNTAGTFSLLTVSVPSNPGTAGQATIVNTINGTNGNLSVSVSAGTTGYFTDISHTDTITTGTAVCCGAGITSSLTINQISIVFTASSGSYVKTLVNSNGTSVLSTASTQEFIAINGGLVAPVTTEAQRQLEFFVNGTLNNMYLYLSANARTTTTTYGSRINSANGNLSISVPASTTGALQDTTDSDTLSSTGSIVNFYVTTGTGSGSITARQIAVQLTTSDSTSVVGTTGNNVAQTGGTTSYLDFGGGMGAFPETGSTGVQCQLQIPLTVSYLSASVITNGVAASSTVRLRKNASNGSSAASIPSRGTGIFTDTNDSDSALSTDLLDYAWISGGSSGSQNIIGITSKINVSASSIRGDLLAMMGVGT